VNERGAGGRKPVLKTCLKRRLTEKRNENLRITLDGLGTKPPLRSVWLLARLKRWRRLFRKRMRVTPQHKPQ
jgi:hypothetical protein